MVGLGIKAGLSHQALAAVGFGDYGRASLMIGSSDRLPARMIIKI